MKEQVLAGSGPQGEKFMDGGDVMHSQHDLQPQVLPLRYIFLVMAFTTLFMGAAAVMAMQ